MTHLPDKLPERRPVTPQTDMLCELLVNLEDIDPGYGGLPELALVQLTLDDLGHADIAERLGTAVRDLTAAIRDAHDALTAALKDAYDALGKE